MIGLLWFVLAVFIWPFRSNARLEAENAVLRQQLLVLRRKCRGGVRLTNGDRLFFVQLYRWFPSVLQVLHIVRPETLVRWHRAGFRSYWRWKSRNRGGRPQIDRDLRALIVEMSLENPLWGAPRIHGELLKLGFQVLTLHGELLKLGFQVAQSTVAKYMERQGRPPGQSWWTFLRNHPPEIAAMDPFVVPTLAFNLLYGLIIVRLDRRELVWIAVTNSPTADWIARQITEAFPWESAPRYLIRDRDRVFASVVRQRLRTMGIRDKPIAPRAWAVDPLVPLAAGKHTAQAIPGAKLEIIPGMGHDLPPGLVPTLSRIILDHCRTVDAVAGWLRRDPNAILRRSLGTRHRGAAFE